MRYIELNPVRARMVRKPGNYPWSSYRANAEGAADPLLTEHALYRALGATPKARAASYRGLFGAALPDEFMNELRHATNGGWALGSARWRAKVERTAKRRAVPRPAGRHAKRPKTEPGQGRLL